MTAKYQRRPKRNTRSYKLECTTIEGIDALAQELGVFQSSLVDFLLKRALTEVNAGNWQLESKPIAFDVTWKENFPTR